MNHLQEQEQIERRMAHNRAKDGRRHQRLKCCECGKRMNELETNYGTPELPCCLICYDQAQHEVYGRVPTESEKV